MNDISVNIQNITINKNLVSAANIAYNALLQKTGKGNNFLGWLDLPQNTNDKFLDEINIFAQNFKKDKDFIVIIGIGGSYLGAKAVITALSDNFAYLKQTKKPEIIFAGQNISSEYITELLELLNNKSFGIVVISKSGTTTEPAIAFRFLHKLLKSKYTAEETSKRIVVITDQKKGALKQLADKENIKQFIIPDDVGGRFSVLTPVGLLPIALAGYNINELINGAKKIRLELLKTKENIAVNYAIARNSLYNNNKTIEILVNYNPKLRYFSEWWKQLFGESEGKNEKGIFPSSVNFTTDLHSLGQYIQQGKKQIFETIINIEKPKSNIKIPETKENLDNLNYLSNKTVDYVNKMAQQGTSVAHKNGNVPIIEITIPEINEYYLGELIYFFEFSCAISGYILGINPFDQPGVEEYKKNMFKLLKKPGY